MYKDADRKWYIDPMIEEIRTHWKLWVLAKISLFILDWDPIDYQWTDPYTGNKFNFFCHRHTKCGLRWNTDDEATTER